MNELGAVKEENADLKELVVEHEKALNDFEKHILGLNKEIAFLKEVLRETMDF